MKTITLNLPEVLHQKILLEVENMGFTGKSDFIRFLIINHFLRNGSSIEEAEDQLLQEREAAMLNSLSKYMSQEENISKVIHVE